MNLSANADLWFRHVVPISFPGIQFRLLLLKRLLLMPTSRQITRRQFLEGIAAAGAASILLSSSHRAIGYQSPNDRPVFATIGLRNQGWTITEKSFRFADFAALADVDANILGSN